MQPPSNVSKRSDASGSDRREDVAEASSRTHLHHTPNPFDKLSNEMLMEIFKAFAEDLGFSRPQRSSFTSLALSAVSRRWRAVALAMPQLWRCIRVRTPRHLEWMEHALALTRHHLLDFYIEMRHEDISRGLLTLLQDPTYLWRTRELIIDLTSDEDSAPDDVSILLEIEVILRQGAPVLEQLQIAGYERAGHNLPQLALDSDHLPALRVLHLDNIRPPWVAGLFGGLQQLTLLVCRDHQATPLSSVLDVLEASQQLEELYLEISLPFDGKVWPNKLGRVVSMPKLRTLHVDECLEEMRVLLRHLRIPASVRASLKAYMDDPTETLSAILPRDPDCMPFLENTTSVHLGLLDAPSGEIKYTSSTDSGEGLLEIELQYDDPESDHVLFAPGMLKDFQALFSRSPLRRLSVECDLEYISDTEWTSFFRSFPSLRELRVSGWGYPGELLAALASGTTSPSFRAGTRKVSEAVILGATTRTVLPNLEILAFDSLPFHDRMLETVVRLLRARAACGLPRLRELRARLRGRQPGMYVHSIHEYDLRTLHGLCEVMVYEDLPAEKRPMLHEWEEES
ncbi:hypothetical protein BV20DRAFT_1001052 [Pilatotrama ljubarskyi]|nr:hypothetical protein BV20DRAFT_1001052 [Pilatotrama ljubarskyi]